MPWEGNRRGGRSKVGLKLGGFKGEASAQAPAPWDRGCLWASSQGFLVKQTLAYLGSWLHTLLGKGAWEEVRCPALAVFLPR